MASSPPPFKGTAAGIFLVATGVSVVAHIVADEFPPNPYQKWTELISIMSFAAVGGAAFGQEKTLFRRLVYAGFFCVVIGSIDAFFYGEPELDPDDPSVAIAEGFKTTFASKAVVGLDCFLKLLGGATVGICMSELLKKIEKD